MKIGGVTALILATGTGILAKVSYATGNIYGTVSAMIFTGLSVMLVLTAISYIIEPPNECK